jgi:hypothetical protein
MTLTDTLAMHSTAAWDRDYDHAGEHSNDLPLRGIVPIARRNAGPSGMLAECGHCGILLDMRKRAATAHVVECERDNRPYAFGR